MEQNPEKAWQKKPWKDQYTSYEHLDSRYSTNTNELRSTTQTTESQWNTLIKKENTHHFHLHKIWNEDGDMNSEHPIWLPVQKKNRFWPNLL